MDVSVKIFSLLREKMGTDELAVSVNDNAIANDVIQHLGTTYPQLLEYLPYARLAVNCTYSTGEELIDENDEIAILLPSSGG